MDVHVHHEVPSQQTPTLLTVHVSVISDSSPIFSTVIPQSLPSSTPPPQQSTSTPPPTTEAIYPPSTLPDFASVFQFNNRVTTLEKEVVELKKDPLHTQVTALSKSRINCHIFCQRKYLTLPPPLLVILKMIQESLEDAVLAKDSSQPQSSYEAAVTLTEFELKKILIDKMDKSESYLAPPKHRDCYEGLRKSYDLDKSIFSIYGKVYSLKRSRKDKDEDPSARSDRGLKKRKTSKDAEPTKDPKDWNMPQDQEDNLGNDDVEPKEKVATKRDWFTKPTQPQEPTGPDWNVVKTPQQGQNQSWLMTLASSANKPSKTFNESMSTPINFFAFIMNGLKINNLTQETLLGPAFRLLKGTCSNYAELEYDFEECYKALSEKLDWENPEGGDYPFDLTKPLPLVMSKNHQKVPVDYFFNNDLKYPQGGILTMTYKTSLTKTKASQYDLPGIEDMVPNLWVPVKVTYDKHAVWGISHWREQRKSFYGYAQGLQSRHDVYSIKRILAVTQVEVMRKHGYGYLKEIVVRRADNDLYRFKEGYFQHLRINDIEDMLLLVVRNRLINLSGDDVSDFAIALIMFTRSLVIQNQVKDLQLGVESYQKKINVTKP
ncbi:hypothetical protein Tco_0955644 [Tanacetum coccineum]|uniref:Uncharacterized protein n=1 Tax=Tanacetum coccineum TaxID=301880 RepID=A0ABQ5E7Y2_9ASTR